MKKLNNDVTMWEHQGKEYIRVKKVTGIYWWLYQDCGDYEWVDDYGPLERAYQEWS